MLILYIVIVGMFAGWLADAVLHRGATRGQQFAVGIIGSFVGGLIASLLAGDGIRLRPSGMIGSIVGALVVFAVWNPRRARSH